MNILMVCLGNICRSPLAQGILEKKAQHMNIQVDSAGTASFHVGKKPDIRSIDIARKNDIDITNQRARKFDINDFNKFDIIYVMDIQNYHDLSNLTQDSNKLKKIKLILDILEPNKKKSVPDPYYGGKDGFKDVYKILEKACTKIITEIE